MPTSCSPSALWTMAGTCAYGATTPNHSPHLLFIPCRGIPCGHTTWTCHRHITWTCHNNTPHGHAACAHHAKQTHCVSDGQHCAAWAHHMDMPYRPAMPSTPHGHVTRTGPTTRTHHNDRHHMDTSYGHATPYGVDTSHRFIWSGHITPHGHPTWTPPMDMGRQQRRIHRTDTLHRHLTSHQLDITSMLRLDASQAHRMHTLQDRPHGHIKCTPYRNITWTKWTHHINTHLSIDPGHWWLALQRPMISNEVQRRLMMSSDAQ